MIEINLIPDVKREYLRAKAMRNAVVSMSVLVGIGVVGLALILGLVFGGQLVAEGLQERTIKDEETKLRAIEDLDKVVVIQQQLGLIDAQHQSKNINSRLFDLMTAINPPEPNNVAISVLRLDAEEKTILVEGSAVNGYVALEVLKKTITNTYIQRQEDGEDVRIPLAENIVTGETSFGENAEGRLVLRFRFTFTYPDELFTASNERVSLVTPEGRIDVTDSKLGVPESLFKQQADDVRDGGNDGE